MNIAAISTRQWIIALTGVAAVRHPRSPGSRIRHGGTATCRPVVLGLESVGACEPPASESVGLGVGVDGQLAVEGERARLPVLK